MDLEVRLFIKTFVTARVWTLMKSNSKVLSQMVVKTKLTREGFLTAFPRANKYLLLFMVLLEAKNCIML